MATIIQQQRLAFNGDGTISIVQNRGIYDNPNLALTFDEQVIVKTERFRPVNKPNSDYEVKATYTGDSTHVVNQLADWTSADEVPNYTSQLRKVDTPPEGVDTKTNAVTVSVRKKSNHSDTVSAVITLTTIIRTEEADAPLPPPSGPIDDAFLSPWNATYFGQDYNNGSASLMLYMQEGTISINRILQPNNPGAVGAYTSNTTTNIFAFTQVSPVGYNEFEAKIELISRTGNVFSDDWTNYTTSNWLRWTAANPTPLARAFSDVGSFDGQVIVARIIVRRVTDLVEVMRKRIELTTSSVN